MDAGTLGSFEIELRRVVPALQVKFKEESRLQRLLGVLIYPLNPKYMRGCVTTFGNTIYFSSRADYTKDPDNTFSKMAHEFVHIMDSKRDPLFKVKRLFPQVLVLLPVLCGILAGSHARLLVFPLLSYVVGSLICQKSRIAFFITVALGLFGAGILGWWFTGWKILSILGLVLAGPWPAPWRREYEIRGYGMCIAVLQWRHGGVSKEALKSIVRQFTGPAHFYMCCDVTYLERMLEATRQQAQVGALQKDPAYGVVFDFLSANRFTFRAA